MARENDHATRTISIVMVITLLGKVLGLFRDHLMAVHYGTVGMEAKAFYIASRIPRVFFDVVFASAIAACFIPVFSEYLTQRGKKEAFRFGGNFLSVMTLLTALLTGLGILFAEPLVTLFADGYDPETAALAPSEKAPMPTELTALGGDARWFTIPGEVLAAWVPPLARLLGAAPYDARMLLKDGVGALLPPLAFTLGYLLARQPEKKSDQNRQTGEE